MFTNPWQNCYLQRRPKPDSRIKDKPEEKEQAANDATSSETKEIDPAHREGTATTTSTSDKPKASEPAAAPAGKGGGGGEQQQKSSKESRRRKKNKDAKGEQKSPDAGKDNRDAVKMAETVDWWLVVALEFANYVGPFSSGCYKVCGTSVLKLENACFIKPFLHQATDW